ncbi:MAG: Exosome complex RNA-binding protein Rrp42 [Candidatus Alkanophagales archaeon MCA70_species_2]|nr:Exosome complex RNA-binding protein Rrp42 [Candidatus Alkanophaga liquidiphilum]RLG36804.1 MAG: RNA-binding protein [Candidatus Alkanophagales archaeon]
MSEVLDEIRKDYLFNLVRRGKRIDGRGFHDFRELHIRTNVISKAEGSAWVELGLTEVLVGVKLQPGEPFPDTPDKGVIITNAELVPLASPMFEPGPPDENGVELARVVDRGIRESGALNLEKLCIEEGEKVWIVFIDVHVLNHEGNLIDASALGAIAALATTRIPCERYGLGNDEKLPVRDLPVSVTAVDIAGEVLIDPNLYEESAASCRLTVISNTDGTISAMQKGGTGGLSPEITKKTVKVAVECAKDIRENILSGVVASLEPY